MSIEKEIGGFIGRLLRDDFGRGPGSVHCVVADPFITVHVTNFMSPMEKSLMEREYTVYVQKTRDLLMEKLMNEINVYIEQNIGKRVHDFYYDWNLEAQSGAFLFLLSPFKPSLLSRQYRNKDKVHSHMNQFSSDVQKQPQAVFSEMLSPKTLLVARVGILVPIEKELVQFDFEETLRIAKRSLEKRALEKHQPILESLLGTPINDYFVDWDYQKDIGYTLVFLS
ncbi:Na-translocating system protein MpsC family protein [Bacillus sp. FJAT-27225]|uniref:Na-translocating system protein MpsC family protein n=1 Tax=Bacillus sp. FJAT-27225 TaxID=1743144 RepID=UPI0020C7D40A|nr:Na-translocating system protein MpsC family protein [Bacillus sp. FJAT-27225]